MKRHAIRTIVFLGAFLSVILPVVQAQGKNEIGLVIGATVTPGRNFAPGSSTPSASFDSSLALGAEYDHRRCAVTAPRSTEEWISWLRLWT